MCYIQETLTKGSLFLLENKMTVDNEGELIAELLCITGELGGKMQRLTTYDSKGTTSKKIVIEYDIIKRENI